MGPWLASSRPSLDEPIGAVLEGASPGAILRCARDRELGAAEVDRIARTSFYTGRTLTSDVDVLRVVYRTQRGGSPAIAGFSAAAVLLPRAARAQRLPVVVIAHGTVDEAPSCPPSKESASGAATYLAELGYGLAGSGYVVILPDYAGYAAFGTANNPIAGYHASDDEARSVLDAARALRNLAAERFTESVVLVGHSQGGHAVLSALAAHASYGSGGWPRNRC